MVRMPLLRMLTLIWTVNALHTLHHLVVSVHLGVRTTKIVPPRRRHITKICKGTARPTSCGPFHSVRKT